MFAVLHTWHFVLYCVSLSSFFRETCTYVPIHLEKLRTGVPFPRVIGDVNETAPADLTPHLQKKVPPSHGFSRVQLGVSRQFLQNVCRDRQIGGIRHCNDSVSVEIQLKEYTDKTGQSPVLFEKEQGKQSLPSEELQKDDFCLVIQTANQREMLKMYGNRGICIDSTHKTNKYDFLLYSGM